jgi:peptidoglycan/LPS O-acetylase OafA/YrhL
MNGLYEAFCIIVLFPLIVALGAGGSLQGKHATRIGGFLGDISYPVYITHYPLIYLYTAWVGGKHLSLAQSYPAALLVFFGSFALAYASLQLYDVPARNWLKRRFLMQPKMEALQTTAPLEGHR